MQIVTSSQTDCKAMTKIRNRLSIKKAAGKIKTVKYVVGMLLSYTSQIPTGKKCQSINKYLTRGQINQSSLL